MTYCCFHPPDPTYIAHVSADGRKAGKWFVFFIIYFILTSLVIKIKLI